MGISPVSPAGKRFICIAVLQAPTWRPYPAATRFTSSCCLAHQRVYRAFCYCCVERMISHWFWCFQIAVPKPSFGLLNCIFYILICQFEPFCFTLDTSSCFYRMSFFVCLFPVIAFSDVPCQLFSPFLKPFLIGDMCRHCTWACDILQ